MTYTKATIEKLYRVVLISDSNYAPVFNGTKDECKEFKKANRKMGKLAIQFYDQIFHKL